MKRIITIILLCFILGACAAPVQPVATTIETITPTTAPTATSTPLPPTPTLSPVEPLLAAYLAGQSIDVSQLSSAECKEFSVKLAEKKNAERGINPVLYKNEAYLRPDNYMMDDYDGNPDMSETIIMYLAIAGRDSEGNLQIIDENGQTVTIANSADVDWNMVVTDPNDPRIDLAHTGEPSKKNLGLSIIQSSLLTNDTQSIYPIILLEKNPGNIYLEGDKGGMMVPTYQILKVETDQKGNPIIAKKILIYSGTNSFARFTEGSETGARFTLNPIENLTDSDFHIGLETNHFYYFIAQENQEEFYTTNIFVRPQNYTGLLTENDGFAAFNNQIKNSSDIVVIGGGIFIKRK